MPFTNPHDVLAIRRLFAVATNGSVSLRMCMRTVANVSVAVFKTFTLLSIVAVRLMIVRMLFSNAGLIASRRVASPSYPLALAALTNC